MREINLKDSSFPISDNSELANDKEGNDFRDPIDWSELKRGWIHAPRFIKIGKYVFALDTLLKRLFAKPLLNDKWIHHPIEERYLKDEEQTKLIRDLSQLLGLESSQFLNYWDPYYKSPRRNDPQYTDHPAIRNAAPDDRGRLIQTLLFLADLQKLIPDFNRLSEHQLIEIIREIKPDYFASWRLINFFDQFPLEVRDTKIKKDDANFVTFRSIVEEELKRTFPYHIGN